MPRQTACAGTIVSRYAYTPYEPLSVPKPVGEAIWIVDGPEITFGLGPLHMPFPTRMTVIRLPDGALWLHSPIALDEALVGQVERLGPVAHLVASNTLHYWWMKDWQARFPEAQAWAVVRLDPQARSRVGPHRQLAATPPAEWQGMIEQEIVAGSMLMEAVFFHHPSRSLILTDLIENFEKERFRSRVFRWLARLGGVLDPDGKAPVDLRLTFRKARPALRAAVERMIAWEPRRVIVAHGRWYGEDGVAELRRAFRWVL
jgi:hypothetical protein